jgi:hypothetical protein
LTGAIKVGAIKVSGTFFFLLSGKEVRKEEKGS